MISSVYWVHLVPNASRSCCLWVSYLDVPSAIGSGELKTLTPMCWCQFLLSSSLSISALWIQVVGCCGCIFINSCDWHLPDDPLSWWEFPLPLELVLRRRLLSLTRGKLHLPSWSWAIVFLFVTFRLHTSLSLERHFYRQHRVGFGFWFPTHLLYLFTGELNPFMRTSW